MLSVHVMTNVPPLARSYQDGGCRIAERVSIRTIKKQTNKQNKTKPTRSNQTNKQKRNKTKQDKTRQDKINKELPGWRLQNCGEGEY